jgi:peptide chain release factor 2
LRFTNLRRPLSCKTYSTASPPARRKSNTCWCVFDFDTKQNQLQQLQTESETPEFWSDPARAQGLMKQIAALREDVEAWQKLRQTALDHIELAALGDESLRADLEIESAALEKQVAEREFTIMLSGKFDRGNALLAINAGAGGTDSQDWAQMLQRMYLRWAEDHKFKAEILDLTDGEEAGIKSVTLSIAGAYAYGNLRSEKGVHRLVRLSPFDSAHRRHTSFALVEVLPEVEDTSEVAINPDDLRIDVYRSSGAGGQNVQKNSTAIRLLHIPTGIIVTCQNERSQLQNRDNAMKVLRARLLALKQAERAEEMAAIKGDFLKIEWGSQIRSYVLHPYQMVKDHRTEFEVSNAQGVLDGNLDGFIHAYLQANVGQ